MFKYMNSDSHHWHMPLVLSVDTGVVSRRQAPHVEARISGTETCLHPASSPDMTPDQAPKASAQVMLGWKGHGLLTLKFLWSDSVAAGPSPVGVGGSDAGLEGTTNFSLTPTWICGRLVWRRLISTTRLHRRPLATSGVLERRCDGDRRRGRN